jgi:hypothetical protein
LKTKKISDADFIAKHKEELSYRELSVYFSISIPTVQMYVKRLNLPKRELIDRIDRDRFTKMWNDGHSASKIGRELGICGTTVMRVAQKMGLKDRTLKKSIVASEPKKEAPVILSILTRTAEKTIGIVFVVPPTLKQLEKQKLQAEMARAKREYRVYKRECGYTARKDKIE